MLTEKRLCQATNESGEPCGQPPLYGSEYCFWHDPDHAQDAAKARQLGGQRRRKEKAVQGAYDIAGLESVSVIQRLVEIAVLDTLALENSIARSQTLLKAALVAAKLLEVGEVEERLEALEATLKPREPAKPRRRR